MSLFVSLRRALAKLDDAAESYDTARSSGISVHHVTAEFEYAPKLHVVGINRGPSCFIGLGEYEGGDLWIHVEENGDTEVRIPCAIPKWPKLVPGTMAKGRLVSCQNKWVHFDGTVHH